MATMKYQIDDYKQTFRLSNLPAGSFYKDEKKMNMSCLKLMMIYL